jgi:hypothetical protein
VSQDPISKLYANRLGNSDKYLAATRSGTISLTSTASSVYYESLWIISGDFNNLSIRNASNDLSLVVNNRTLTLGDTSTQNTAFRLEKTVLPSYGYAGDGYYTIQSAVNENYYLGILTNTRRKGDNISLVTKDASLKTYISKSSDGTFIIEDSSRTRRLDMEGGASYNGANVGIWDDNGSHCNQKWIISQSSDTTSKIFESCNKRALEVYGGIAANGTNIGVWDSHTGINQSWIIRKAEP